ncbi:hypothetical protein MICAC_5210008 [Microcystis aeruginosa PCC 9443]|uniref:Uncharacterized protein n=1 Tax=Microcystis aeruginosa PCC 9443 TaxID=1160281 RepID=I4G7Q8_MICAE|nr:hypothetical protein MICAC_5210008 [Microcystis aeruginosa PCC 9443]
MIFDALRYHKITEDLDNPLENPLGNTDRHWQTDRHRSP